MNEMTTGVSQEIRFYRTLLLNAALEHVSGEYGRQGKMLPPLQQLCGEAIAYWRALVDAAVMSGTLEDMTVGDIRQWMDDLTAYLPQYR